MTATVYIAGPMTGYQHFNREAFNAAAAHLRAKGYTVVNPAEMDEDMTVEDLSATPHHVFMRRDIAALLDCDLIYTLPGWRHSKGATLEMAVAQGCGIDRLKDADVEAWRTFEGDPEIESPLRVESPFIEGGVLLCAQPPTTGVSAADLAAEVRLAASEGRRV